MANNNSLKEFLDKSRERRVSVAHIHGPHRTSKTSAMIPYIWLVVRTDPSAVMVYIQPTKTQAELARSVIVASDAGYAADLESGRLQLSWSAAAARAMVKSPAKFEGNIVVCVDIDVVPTAHGEFLLACMVERAMRVDGSEDSQDRLVFVTLGAGKHRFPRHLAPFASPTTIRIGSDDRVPEVTSVVERVDLVRSTMDIVADIVKRGGGLVLAFLHSTEHKASLQQAVFSTCYSQGQRDFSVCNLTLAKLQQPHLVMQLFRKPNGCVIVFVDPAITVTLPFHSVRAVFYAPEREAQVLDGFTGLCCWKTELCSAPEIEMYRSYTAARPSDAGQPRAVRIDTDPDWRNQAAPKRPVSQAHGAQLPLLVLLAYCKWWCRAAHMPLAHLQQMDEAKWLEAVGLLRRMGLVSKTDDPGAPWKATKLALLTVSWLLHVVDWRVAAFLAHLQGKETALERRVMIILAAIMEHEVPLEVNGGMSRGLMREVVRTACGPAASMVDYGHLWVALSVWEQVRRSTNDFATANDDDEYPVLDGRVVLKRAKAIYGRARALERAVTFPPAAGTDTTMDRPISLEELSRINLALKDAWISNVFWIPKDWNQEQGLLAKCLAHGDDISVNTRDEAIVMDGLLDTGGLFATSLSIMTDVSGGLVAWRTLLLDTECIRHIHEQRVGNSPHVRATFASVYAHRGRAEE